MPHTREKFFYPKPSSFSNKLFFDVGSTLIIIQREFEKKKKVNLNLKFYNVSDLNLNISHRVIFRISKLQRARFWIEKYTTR